MSNNRIALWNIDDDILDAATWTYHKDYVTVIAASGHAPPVGTIVICGSPLYLLIGGIRALGKVYSKQAVSTARVRSRIQPLHLLEHPIDSEELDRIVARRFDHHVFRALNDGVYSDTLYPKLLTERSSAMILEALREASNEASAALDTLSADVPVLPNLEKLRLQEERDAANTAIRFANLSRTSYLRGPSVERLEPGMPFGLCFARQYIDNEDDLIAADLRRFDNNAELHDLAGSTVRVTDRDLCLTIINVNRKPLETVFGVDLVYYDHIGDTAVGVQYKRLEKEHSRPPDSTPTDWIYRNKSQLAKQLDLMRKESFLDATSADDWRLSSSPNFFKFVRAEDFNPNGRTLLKGMYVPDEYLRLGIQEGKFETGPRGGFQIGYSNTRYFTSETFIELVRRTWIGTQTTDRSALAEKVAELAIDDEVVLAIRSART